MELSFQNKKHLMKRNSDYGARVSLHQSAYKQFLVNLCCRHREVKLETWQGKKKRVESPKEWHVWKYRKIICVCVFVYTQIYVYIIPKAGVTSVNDGVTENVVL